MIISVPPWETNSFRVEPLCRLTLQEVVWKSSSHVPMTVQKLHSQITKFSKYSLDNHTFKYFHTKKKKQKKNIKKFFNF